MNKKLYFNMLFYILGTFIVLTMGVIIGKNFIKDSRLLASTVMAQETSGQDASQTAKPSASQKPKNSNGTVTEGTSGTFVYVREKEPVKATPKPSVSPTPTKDVPDLKPIDSNTPGAGSPSPSTTPSPSASPSPGATTKPSATPGANTTPGATPTPGGTTNPGGTSTITPQSSVTQKIKVEVVNKSGRSNLAETVRQKLESAGYEVSAGNESTVSPVKTEIIIRKDSPAAQNVKNYIPASKISVQSDANYKYDVTVIIGDDYN